MFLLTRGPARAGFGKAPRKTAGCAVGTTRSLVNRLGWERQGTGCSVLGILTLQDILSANQQALGAFWGCVFMRLHALIS